MNDILLLAFRTDSTRMATRLPGIVCTRCVAGRGGRAARSG
jgi:hypothetical protein